MFSEEAIVRLVQSNVEYRLHFLGTHVCIRPLKLTTSTIVSIALVSHFTSYATMFPTTIIGLVSYILFISIWVLIMAFLKTNLFDDEERETDYQNFCQIDSGMNTEMPQRTDWTLLVIAGLNILLVVSVSVVVYVRGMDPLEFTWFSTNPIFYKIILLAMMKHLVLKRLKYIRTAEEFMDRIEDTISLTRRLLDFNKRLNYKYGLLSSTFAVYTFQVLLHYFYSIWAVHGANMIIPYSPANHVFSSVVFYNLITIIVVLQATICSNIAGEVSNSKLL